MIHPYYHAPYFYRLQRSGELWTIVQYLLTSAIVSAVDYATFWIFYNPLSTGLFEATAAAYIAGLVTSYILNRYWVFKKNASGQQFSTSIFRYATLLLVNFFITYGMLWAMQDLLGISPFIGKFIVWTFLIFWNYAMDKVWVFKGPRQVRKTLDL
jgi:putative flippase GtrA